MKKQKFILVSNQSEEKFEGTLAEAKADMDKYITYCQEDMIILDENKNLICSRKWYGCRDGIESSKNPIDFGEFGFYDDWSDEKEC